MIYPKSPKAPICCILPMVFRPISAGKPLEQGLITIDATCPLVTKVHTEAIRFAREGYIIILIGHAGHDEVVGTMGEAPDSIILVQTPEDVDRLDLPDSVKIAYLTQTTCRSTMPQPSSVASAAIPAYCRPGPGGHLLRHPTSARGGADAGSKGGHSNCRGKLQQFE